MKTEKLEEMAKTLHNARLNAQAIKQFSSHVENFSRAAAYQVQELGIEMREQDSERIIGMKMGLTSEKKRKQMNLDAPLYGILTDKMQVIETYALEGSIHPKIEPEIVFYLKKDLQGEVSREEVLAACEAVGPALEILDSRYEGFKYFSMEDVIADNSSSSHYVLGPKSYDFQGLDLKNLKMEMLVDGKVAESGISSDISGDPVVSVMQLAALLGERGQLIPAGCFVLAGAATAAVNLRAQMTIELRVEGMTPMQVGVK